MTEVTTLLGDLVRVDTSNPPGNESRAAEILQTWLAEHSIDSRLEEVEPGRANLVARVQGAQPGKTLTFNTHMDVVPAGDGWAWEAFSGAVSDGVVRGRGATDAKGSLAAMAGALVDLSRKAQSMKGQVQIAAVVDEEVGSAGARTLAPKLETDGVVVGEPTNLQVMTAHKGSVRPIVEVRGRAAHAARPDRGVNALEAAAGLLRGLWKLRSSFERRTHPALGRPTIVPVLAEAGEAPNMVPECCRITFDRRLVPPETESEAIAEIEEWLDRFHQEHPTVTAAIVDQAPTTGGASETSPGEPLVRASQKAVTDFGLSGDLGALTVNCDMTHFRKAGVPGVICGPGSPDAMHVVNETLSVEQLQQAVQVYTRIVEEFLQS